MSTALENSRTKEAGLATAESIAERSAPSVSEPAPAPVVMTVEGLGVTYAGCSAPALESITFVLREGETVALVGPSGGGKTTLLRALEGSVAATSGSVKLHGKTALIYQDLRLVPEQSVLSNVCSGALSEVGMAGGMFGFPAHIRERAMGLLDDLGLQGYATSKVCCLSGGQRQRVAIARALCAGPRILLADEPMASLDPQNSERILTLLASLQKKYHFALVLSIHDEGPDPAFFQRYFVLRDGRVALETRDADEAWESFSKANSAAAAAESDDAIRVQDRAMAATDGTMKAVKFALWSLAALLVLAWSARALNLSGAAFAGAFKSVFEFLSKIVPANVADAKALPWAQLGASLLETIQMAVWGTAIGIVISLPLAVLASRETAPRLIRYPVRFLLNTIRTVPSIFWALVFVAFVGLGPLAGVFALAAYSVGYLTKFFYEGLEDADDRPASALRALGASRLQIFFRAILPAARPVLAGSCLFVFEYNIRSASVLGVVGAGGIGQDLMYYIEWRNFPAATAGLLMILAVVVALDTVSHCWRRRLSRDRGI